MPRRDDPLADAARHMSMLCGNVQERSKTPDEHLLRLGVTILERIHEAGLVSGEPGGHPIGVKQQELLW